MQKSTIKVFYRGKRHCGAVVILIALISTLCVACTQTTSIKNTTSNEPDKITYLAKEVMKRDIENYEQNPAVKIIDSKITRLEVVKSFDDLAEKRIDVYALEYRLLPKDLSKVVLAGGMSVDEDGWLKETCSMGRPLLVIYHNGDKIELKGILWTGGVQEEGGLRESVKKLLISIN